MRTSRLAGSPRFASLVGAWLVLVACGRIGFDSEPAAVDATRPIDTAVAPCLYLSSCGVDEVTCCTGMDRTCQSVQAVCIGEVAECDVGSSQGCQPGWPCCQTTQEPQARCYDPQFPVPC